MTSQTHFSMKDDIGENEHDEDHQYAKISPVFAGDDLAPGDQRNRGKKCRVDDRRNNATELRRSQERETASEPKRGEACKRPAVDRQPSGPVRNCRKQEASDSRSNIAIEHLVNVPIERAQMRWNAHFAHVLGDPESNADDRPQTSRQKERAEAVREDCRAAIVAAALQSGRYRHSDLSSCRPNFRMLRKAAI